MHVGNIIDRRLTFYMLPIGYLQRGSWSRKSGLVQNFVQNAQEISDVLTGDI